MAKSDDLTRTRACLLKRIDLLCTRYPAGVRMPSDVVQQLGRALDAVDAVDARLWSRGIGACLEMSGAAVQRLVRSPVRSQANGRDGSGAIRAIGGVQ